MTEFLLPKDAPELIKEEVLQQLNKDLHIGNIEIISGEKSNLQDYAIFLEKELDKLMEIKSPLIMKMVNRIDLSEKQMKNLSTFKGKYTENLAKAIVLRAFQKVMLRKKFS